MSNSIFEILAENEYEAVLHRVCIFETEQEAQKFLDNLDPEAWYAENVDSNETLILEECFFGENAGSKKLREVQREYDDNNHLIIVSDKKI